VLTSDDPGKTVAMQDFIETIQIGIKGQYGLERNSNGLIRRERNCGLLCFLDFALLPLVLLTQMID
jgi:hypothetical protein